MACARTATQMEHCTVNDIEEAVVAWYAALGQKVPPVDKGWLRVYREEEVAASGALWTEPLPDAVGSAASEKLVYGTPEFWKNFWMKKNAKKKAEALAAQSIL